MEIDPHITVGNLITIGAIVFGAGGAWYSAAKGMDGISVRLTELASGVAKIREEFVRKDVDLERERMYELRLQSLQKQLDASLVRISELEKLRLLRK